MLGRLDNQKIWDGGNLSDVMEATAGRQEPYTYGSPPAREDFFFDQR
jgi:hypothetical protein